MNMERKRTEKGGISVFPILLLDEILSVRDPV